MDFILSLCIYVQCTGYLSYDDYVFMEYNIEDNITLKVAFTDDNITKHIQSLGWFYNNTPICVCSCSSHYILSNDSKKLTIVNASAADVGVYEARITSYQFLEYNSELCDRAMSEQLEYHAAIAPVVYTLSYKGKQVKEF